jgi:hypothetical protein
MRKPRVRTSACIVVVALAAPAVGLAAPRDFQAPAERIVDRTAYTLTARQVRIDAGLVGLGTDDLGVNLGVAYGLTDWVELRLNLAHFGIGMLNVAAQFNLVDRRWWGLGVVLGLRWLRGDWLWLLRERTREQLAGVDMLGFPLEVVGSFPLLRWMGLHLKLAYTHSEVFGDIAFDEAALEGTAGVRHLYVEPVVRFYLWRRMAVTLGARLPLFARAAVQGATEAEVEPALIVGVRGAGWQDIAFDKLASYYGGLEWRFGRVTHLQLFLTHGPLNDVIGTPVLPSINFYWRF